MKTDIKIIVFSVSLGDKGQHISKQKYKDFINYIKCYSVFGQRVLFWGAQQLFGPAAEHKPSI